jgi:hypothetical protein
MPFPSLSSAIQQERLIALIGRDKLRGAGRLQ